MEASGVKSAGSAKPSPKDMSHHYSDVTKARTPSKMKEFYKYFQIPGIGQLAGGQSAYPIYYYRPVQARVAS